MKKSIVLLLAALVLLCGCRTHAHEWTEATCTAPKTCPFCGATAGEPLGHAWTQATCTEPETCSRCGQTEGEPLGHDFSEPTCTEAGVCRRCGETTPASGHDWLDATCLRPKTCARCGLTEGEALGHDMVDGVCTRCGFCAFEPMCGSGNGVLTDVQTGDGIYRAHLRHTSGGNFIVWAYDGQGTADLLTCVRERYDGSVLLFGTAPYTFEVFSSGGWEITIEQLDRTDDLSFAGAGDAVTDLFAWPSGMYRFTYAGENDFVVWLYTADGETLCVQALGACSEERFLTIPQNGLAFFAVRADAAWTIEPAGE